MQILTPYFKRSVVLVIKISPELCADFECPPAKLEICHNIQWAFATQKRWRQILYLLYVYHIKSTLSWRNLTLYYSFRRNESRQL